MKYKTKIIVFEGMPGSGKTRTIKALKKILKERSIIIPQIVLPSSRRDDDFTTSERYLDAEIKKLEKVKKMTNQNQCEYLLIDRTFLTTLAYAYACSQQNNDISSFQKIISYFRVIDTRKHFLRPDCLFLFFVDVNESINRRKKYAENKNFRQWFNPIFLNQMNFFYTKYVSNFGMPKPIIIDTTFINPQEVVLEVCKHLLL